MVRDTKKTMDEGTKQQDRLPGREVKEESSTDKSTGKSSNIKKQDSSISKKPR